MATPVTEIKMNFAEMEKLQKDIRLYFDEISPEVTAHVEMLTELKDNPNMKGSIKHLDAVIEKSSSAIVGLEDAITKLLDVLAKATLLGGETEAKFIKEFEALAGDQFTTTATLDNIEDLDTVLGPQN
jgi:hypothetical protein